MWDPTYASATRPLAFCQGDQVYTYGFDLTKNVCELFDESGQIAASYDYAPYGALLQQTGNLTQPLQWSSEYADSELGLVYYNYRHYNPRDGRWISRDPIGELGGKNLYGFVGNSILYQVDFLGLKVSIYYTHQALGFHWKLCVTNWEELPKGQRSPNSCCYKKKRYKKLDEEYCIGFGPIGWKILGIFIFFDPDNYDIPQMPSPEKRSPMSPRMDYINGKYANGVVTENMGKDYQCSGRMPGHLRPLETTCQQDIEIKKYMQGRLVKEHIIL